jgi:hypothetical protein
MPEALCMKGFLVYRTRTNLQLLRCIYNQLNRYTKKSLFFGIVKFNFLSTRFYCQYYAAPLLPCKLALRPKSIFYPLSFGLSSSVADPVDFCPDPNPNVRILVYFWRPGSGSGSRDDIQIPPDPHHCLQGCRYAGPASKSRATEPDSNPDRYHSMLKLLCCYQVLKNIAKHLYTVYSRWYRPITNINF